MVNKFKKIFKYKYFLLIILFLANTLQAKQVLQVVELQNITAQEIIPQLQPFVAISGTLQGNGQKLIVKTEEDNLKELLDIILVYDIEQQQVLITISDQQPLDANIRSYSTNIKKNITQIKVLFEEEAFVSTTKQLQAIKFVKGESKKLLNKKNEVISARNDKTASLESEVSELSAKQDYINNKFADLKAVDKQLTTIMARITAIGSQQQFAQELAVLVKEQAELLDKKMAIEDVIRAGFDGTTSLNEHDTELLKIAINKKNKELKSLKSYKDSPESVSSSKTGELLFEQQQLTSGFWLKLTPLNKGVKLSIRVQMATGKENNVKQQTWSTVMKLPFDSWQEIKSLGADNKKNYWIKVEKSN